MAEPCRDQARRLRVTQGLESGLKFQALARMEYRYQLKRRFSAMPWLLRTLVTASAGIGIAFSILPLLLGATFGLGEIELTGQELWQTRIAFALFVVGPFMFSVGVAIFLRKSWVRPVLVLLPLLQLLPFLVAHWVFDAPSPVSSRIVCAHQSSRWCVAGTCTHQEHAHERFAQKKKASGTRPEA